MLHKIKSYIALLDSKTRMYVLLFLYHACFMSFAYLYRVQRGMSDAHLYWGLKEDVVIDRWLDFASYGTKFIIFLNYPFIKLGFPFWFGFLLYGLVGFLGIVKWIQWIENVVGSQIVIKGVNVLPLLFFLPNLHIWTAALGKDALVFFGVATIFYNMSINKLKGLSFYVGILLVLIIRPHIAAILLMAIVLVLFFDGKLSRSKKFLVGSISISLLAIFGFMVLKLVNINSLNWDYIKYKNDKCILSFEPSGSYVPMLEYSYPYKLFSFNFRPLFFDASSMMQYLASIENLFFLLIFIVSLVVFILTYKRITLPKWAYIVIVFNVIASVLFVQRCANLGLFMRFKIMFQPFLIIVFIYILLQGLTLNKQK